VDHEAGNLASFAGGHFVAAATVASAARADQPG